MYPATIFLCLSISVLNLADKIPEHSVETQDGYRYLNELKREMARLESRFRDQNERFLTQEKMVEQLKEQMAKQKHDFQDQISKQNSVIRHLKKALQKKENGGVGVNSAKKDSENYQAQQDGRLQRLSEEVKFMKNVAGLHAKQFQSDVTSTSKNQNSAQTDSYNKRSDDPGQLIDLRLDSMAQSISHLQADLQALTNCCSTQTHTAAGSTYIRWGFRSCVSPAELVYSGIMSGSNYMSLGGPGNYLCLLDHPVYDNHTKPTINGISSIYGSEYNIAPEANSDTTPVCAVCRTPHAATVMIPGSRVCGHGWTIEYSGYIMSGLETHSAPSEYVCVDKLHGHTGHSHDNNENMLYYTQTVCGSLPCPPFLHHQLLPCVVCSK